MIQDSPILCPMLCSGEEPRLILFTGNYAMQDVTTMSRLGRNYGLYRLKVHPPKFSIMTHVSTDTEGVELVKTVVSSLSNAAVPSQVPVGVSSGRHSLRPQESNCFEDDVSTMTVSLIVKPREDRGTQAARITGK